MAERFWWYWKALTRTASTPGPKYCHRCGAANDANASQCSGCGMVFNY